MPVLEKLLKWYLSNWSVTLFWRSELWRKPFIDYFSEKSEVPNTKNPMGGWVWWAEEVTHQLEHMCSVIVRHFSGIWLSVIVWKLACMPLEVWTNSGNCQLAVILAKWVKKLIWCAPNGAFCGRSLKWPLCLQLAEYGDASHVGRSVILMIFIVFPNFAVCSRAVSRGIFISLSPLVLPQYVGTVFALALQPFSLPFGKSRAPLAKSLRSLVEHLFTTKFCVTLCGRECLC